MNEKRSEHLLRTIMQRRTTADQEKLGEDLLMARLLDTEHQKWREIPAAL